MDHRIRPPPPHTGPVAEGRGCMSSNTSPTGTQHQGEASQSETTVLSTPYGQPEGVRRQSVFQAAAKVAAPHAHSANTAASGMSALDVGCGSGILSIALSKLGCVTDACDTDEQAVQSSQKNAELNGVKFNQIWTGSVANLDKKYDVVVANIIADVILMLKNDLINLLKEGSYLVLAGVLDKYETRILEAFSSLKPVENQTKNEWKSFVFQKA